MIGIVALAKNLKSGRGRMRKRNIRVPATAALALLIALDGLFAGTPSHAKTRPWIEKPRQVEPPPVHFVKCAAEPDAMPCWPDPGMLRPDRRFNAPDDRARPDPSR
jgi:hypothetical protein